ncbi:hypothetical protein QBC35DRAFT_429152 [Podospora australis]|uniref:SMP-30/Gluconolactonase/LRE-like region domain-containing protein n=1 Tax=Podospora australis TaxID=1536484 RepID=A0AAN6WYM1_9PEZI|nr:hypothetical protein QBC35DRAFT_429152 [Podospora australis]
MSDQHPQEQFQKWKITTPYLNLHCGLGEGPYFEEATNTLRFVDIKKKRLHTVSVSSENPKETVTTLQFTEAVTVTADIEGQNPQEKLLVGAKQGLAVLDRRTGQYEYISKYEMAEGKEFKWERIRSNDGAVDPLGRFWLGTMTDFGLGDFQAEGSLYHFSKSQPPTTVLENLTIPNSVGWSPDGKTMYFTHSTEREVLCWDFDPKTGEMGNNKRVFYKHDGKGEPDGFRVDVEGNLWHAVYGEGKILKIDGTGKLVGEVSLPTKNITCVEFVGEELFVTTAAGEEGDSETEREMGGGLFRVRVGVKGLGHGKFVL